VEHKNENLMTYTIQQAVWEDITICPRSLWPWKWCPSHLQRRLPLCQFYSS